MKGITRSPKSYTLWHHRNWTIEKGLDIEREILKASSGDHVDIHKSKVLEMELKLCDKMLSLDERNFHCWNYRLLVAELYLKEITKRVEDNEAAWNY